jgi:hypothetical protein
VEGQALRLEGSAIASRAAGARRLDRKPEAQD